MRSICSLTLLSLLTLGGFTSCAEEPEKRVTGPTTETSKIPWNRPLSGQGQGQFGMLPTNQHRR